MSSSVSDISIIGRDSSHPRSRNTSKGSVSISQRSSISSSTSTSFSSSSENFTVDPRMIPEWNPDDLSEMLPSGLLPVPKLEDVNIGGAALVSEIKRLRKELDMERDLKQKTIKDYANLQNCLLGQTALFSIVEEELNDLKKKIIPNEDSEMQIEDYITEYRKLIKSRNEERLEKENAEFELQLEISKSFTIDCDDLICRLKSDGRCIMEEKIKRKGLVQSLEKQVSDLEESLYQARKEFKKENKLRIALERELKYLSIFSFDFFDNSVLADCQLYFTCCDQVFFCKDVFNGLIIDDYHSMAEMTRTISEYAVEKMFGENKSEVVGEFDCSEEFLDINALDTWTEIIIWAYGHKQDNNQNRNLTKLKWALRRELRSAVDDIFNNLKGSEMQTIREVAGSSSTQFMPWMPVTY